MSAPGTHQPDWYPDPQGGPGSRWWDGDQWTDLAGPPHLSGRARGGLPSGGLLLAFAGAALVVGSFLPWVTLRVPPIGQWSASGMDGDGKFTAVIGAAIAGGGIYYLANRRLPKVAVIASAVASVLAGLVVGYDLINTHSKVADVDSALASASVGPGLWVCAAGAIAGVVGAAIAHDEQRRAGRYGPPGVPL